MHELSIFPRQGKSDIEAEDFGIELHRGVDIDHGQGRNDAFHVENCSFSLVSEQTRGQAAKDPNVDRSGVIGGVRNPAIEEALAPMRGSPGA